MPLSQNFAHVDNPYGKGKTFLDYGVAVFHCGHLTFSILHFTFAKVVKHAIVSPRTMNVCICRHREIALVTLRAADKRETCFLRTLAECVDCAHRFLLHMVPQKPRRGFAPAEYDEHEADRHNYCADCHALAEINVSDSGKRLHWRSVYQMSPMFPTSLDRVSLVPGVSIPRCSAAG